MKSFSIGHFTNTDQGTGVTVFLFEQPAIAAYCIAGSAPASRELTILDLDMSLDMIHGLTFCGGSAFGLGAANGVMQWLAERNRGVPLPHGVVPIVPTVCIYDLLVKSNAYPTAEQAYLACQQAEIDNPARGRIGAGTGASVGKFIPNTNSMTGGFGFSHLALENGLEVSAYAVVNPIGDVRNEKGEIIAGARRGKEFADCREYLLSGRAEERAKTNNTTLVAVMTNAAFSRIELKRIAKMALSGMALSISPVFTRYDGDLLFCISLGKVQASEVVVGAMAVKAVQQAIINAVSDSVVL